MSPVFKSKIARRLIIAVVLFSSFITLLTTAYQLYWDYTRNVSAIEDRLSEFEKVHLNTLTTQLWIADRKQLEHQMNGILNLSDIQYLEVIEKGGVVLSVGDKISSNSIRRQFDMYYTHRGQKLNIGTLNVVVSLDRVYQQVKEQIWDILVSNAFKTFLVSGFILLLFHYIVTRHLQKIAQFTHELDIDNLDESLTLNRKPNPKNSQDELDEVVYSLGEMQSKLKRSIIALELSEEKVRLLIDSTVEAIYGLNIQGECTFANPACAKMLGYEKAEQLIGKNMHTLIHHSWRDGTPYADDQCMVYQSLKSTKRIHVDSEVLWKKNGQPFDAEYWAYPIVKDGQVVGTVVSFVDVTIRRQNEAELHRYRGQLEKRVEERTAELHLVIKELESYSYSIAHDLRAPLRAITSFSQIIAEDAKDKLSSTELDYLTRIVNSGRFMANLIDDMLDLARITRKEISLESVSLTDIALRIRDKLEATQPSRHVDWHIQKSVNAIGDPNLLEIAMDNLLGNAWKYTGKLENAQISFEAFEDNDALVYVIKDNGAGFNMQYQDKLFKSFQRLHNKHEFEGTGIGLATVERVINRHGGKVWAEAAVDKGATFFFTISPKAKFTGIADNQSK